MKDMDKDGRYPMSGREYLALRTLYGAFNVLLQSKNELKSRCELDGHSWDDLKDATDKLDSVLVAVLRTVPYSKLQVLQMELKSVYLTINNKRPYVSHTDTGAYVDAQALLHLINLAIQDHCFFCEKSYKEGTRHCELYKTIQDTYSYEFDHDSGDDLCPMSGASRLDEIDNYKQGGRP